MYIYKSIFKFKLRTAGNQKGLSQDMNFAKGWMNSLGDLRKTNNPQFEIWGIWEILI